MPDKRPDVKVAIIEDDIAIVQMYRTKFELEGYDVETAGDGLAGMKLIQRFQPDIILLDIMMPTMDGLAMLAALRKQPHLQNSKIIVLTNMGDPDTAAKVLRLGATDYIIKAEMTPKQVSEKIKQVLQG